MKIDFDDLRKRIANHYNGLYLLSDCITDDSCKDSCKTILYNLRNDIGLLLSGYSENEKINAIDYKLFPSDEE